MHYLQKTAMALLLLILSGCAGQETFSARVLWPTPPARPYMELKNVFYSEDQFPKTGMQVFLEGLTGKGELATFSRPFGVAGDNQGIVYISDPWEKNIRVYDFNRRSVEYYSKDNMGTPYGLAVDQKGQLYVVDPAIPGVRIYSANRQPLRVIGSAEELTRPIYIALNERLGRLYLSDSEAGKVVVYSLAGEYLFTFAKQGGAEGELGGPRGIAIDKQDRVFVADGINTHISVFDAEGAFLYRFGVRGDQHSQFEQPRGLAFDSDGNLYIADARKGALLTYKPDGTFLLYTGAGKPTNEAFGFSMPTSLWIDASDQIFVTDTLLKRFSLWQYVSDAYLAAHPITPADQSEIEALLKKAQEEGKQATPSR